MYELALFAGAGGGLLATKWFLEWRAICYVENNPYCVEVLKARIRDGLLDDAPIWDDVRTFDGRPWRGCVDIVTAGFPCQPFSGAGKQRAERDERNLWPDTIRIIREVRPQWVLLENVSRLLSHAYIRQIFGEMAESGYDTRWDCIPASAIGANHQRDRLWIVATHADGDGYKTEIQHVARLNEQSPEPECNGKVQLVAHANGRGQSQYSELDSEQEDHSANRNSCRGYVGGCSDEVADPNCIRCNRRSSLQKAAEKAGVFFAQGDRSWWLTEPALGRVADGVAHRVDQLRALGNGQVPAVVRFIWRILTQ